MLGPVSWVVGEMRLCVVVNSGRSGVEGVVWFVYAKFITCYDCCFCDAAIRGR